MAEAAKRRHEETRNGLEAYLYRLRDLLDDESENPFKKCSTSEERKLIGAKVYELLQWMSDEAEEAQLADLWEKKKTLEYVANKLLIQVELTCHYFFSGT